MRCTIGFEPKACACHRQCYMHRIVPLRDPRAPMPCFERLAVPDGWQTSNFPDEFEEDVVYRRGCIPPANHAYPADHASAVGVRGGASLRDCVRCSITCAHRPAPS